MSLTQAKLKELLRYEPLTGLFTWLVQKSNRVCVGGVAGVINDRGYIQIKIDGSAYKAHRLAWLYMTGAWPQLEIDHKNGIRNDNKWRNLRDVTRFINHQNQRKAQRHNKTGFLGVTQRGKHFPATITVNKKSCSLGTYLTPELAHEAYLKAKRELHEGCAI